MMIVGLPTESGIWPLARTKPGVKSVGLLKNKISRFLSLLGRQIIFGIDRGQKRLKTVFDSCKMIVIFDFGPAATDHVLLIVDKGNADVGIVIEVVPNRDAMSPNDLPGNWPVFDITHPTEKFFFE